MLAMLAAHSRVWAVPYEVRLLERPLAETQELICRFNAEAALAGKGRWVHKTPRQILDIARLLGLLPDARFILMLRDGRDVAVSIRAGTDDLESGARRWVEENAHAEHLWTHPQVLVVRYEDLIEDPTAVLTGVTNFVGEPFEPSMLEHHETSFRFLGELSNLDNFRDHLLRLDDAARR